MASKKTIYLIGMMGAWKTTVGKILAAKLGQPFIDTDTKLMKTAGVSTAELFKTRGEDYFRDQETHLLKQISVNSGHVISTGGGIILQELNRQILRSTGVVILLFAHPRVLLQRMRNLKNRPLLSSSKQPDSTLTKLWYERKDLYQSTAHHEINTENLSPNEVCDEIIHLLELDDDSN